MKDGELEFDDDLELGLSEDLFGDGLLDSEPPRKRPTWWSSLTTRDCVVCCSVGIVVIAALTWWMIDIDGPYELLGVGEGQVELEVGSKVLLNDEEVGMVAEFRLIGGDEYVVMRISEDHRGTLGKQTRFLISGVNKWLPEDPAVVIDAVEPRNDSDVILSGQQVRFEDRYSPANSLSDDMFWVACIVAFAAICFVYKLLLKIIYFAIGVTLLLGVIAYLLQNTDLAQMALSR